MCICQCTYLLHSRSHRAHASHMRVQTVLARQLPRVREVIHALRKEQCRVRDARLAPRPEQVERVLEVEGQRAMRTAAVATAVALESGVLSRRVVMRKQRPVFEVGRLGSGATAVGSVGMRNGINVNSVVVGIVVVAAIVACT